MTKEAILVVPEPEPVVEPEPEPEPVVEPEPSSEEETLTEDHMRKLM